ncbi:MAG: class F sortase [Pseudonocardiaceae bacterium]
MRVGARSDSAPNQRRAAPRWWRRWLPWLGLMLGLALIIAAGVGSATRVTVAPQVGAVPPAAQQAPQPGPTATSVEIPHRLMLPSLRVDAPIVPVSTLPRGGLAVPADPDVLGWWQGGTRPGSGQGTVVIDGHVDTAVDGPGALFHLRELRPGDPVVLSTDHGPRTYVVAALRSFVKADLPAEVFASSGQPRLVIITCGGPFNERTRQYADNVVAYAVPA